MKKTNWKVRRELEAKPDGWQRWDRAYQCLLQWTTASTEANFSASGSDIIKSAEVQNESSNLCAGFHPTTSSSSDD